MKPPLLIYFGVLQSPLVGALTFFRISSRSHSQVLARLNSSRPHHSAEETDLLHLIKRHTQKDHNYPKIGRRVLLHWEYYCRIFGYHAGEAYDRS